MSANGPLLLPATPFSVKLESDRPVVAERALYWGTPSAADPTTPTFPWKEGHVVAGIEQPESKWAFAEGRQGPDPSGATFDSFFLVVNPNGTDIQVRATFATEDGTGVAVTVPVKANTRANIWPVVTGSNPTLDAEFALLQGRRFAVFLESVGSGALPFVAERAMYWNGFAGGHANAGHTVDRHHCHSGHQAGGGQPHPDDAWLRPSVRWHGGDDRGHRIRLDGGGVLRRRPHPSHSRHRDEPDVHGAGAHGDHRATAMRAPPAWPSGPTAATCPDRTSPGT